MNGRDGSGCLGFDGVFHLHGFEYGYLLALFYSVAYLYGYFYYYTRKRCVHGFACTGGSGRSRRLRSR